MLKHSVASSGIVAVTHNQAAVSTCAQWVIASPSVIVVLLLSAPSKGLQPRNGRSRGLARLEGTILSVRLFHEVLYRDIYRGEQDISMNMPIVLHSPP